MSAIHQFIPVVEEQHLQIQSFLGHMSHQNAENRILQQNLLEEMRGKLESVQEKLSQCTTDEEIGKIAADIQADVAKANDKQKEEIIAKFDERVQSLTLRLEEMRQMQANEEQSRASYAAQVSAQFEQNSLEA